MPYYRTCPYCGAHLDPGERCDCRKALEAEAPSIIERLTDEQRAKLREEIKNAPASATNTDKGGVERIADPVSTSNDNRNTEDFQV